ncbi:MAG: hypothetical protein ACJ75B_14270 [Flavisolibacter sp.]
MMYGICHDTVLILFTIGVIWIIFKRQSITKAANMNITIRISSDELPSSQQTTIRTALCLNSKNELAAAFEKIAKTAFLEYCKMILERGTPAKIDEIREQRLFLLIQHYFKDRLPKDNEVDSFFHLGDKSQTLLQNTISHFRNHFTNFNSFLLVYLNNAKQGNQENYFVFDCFCAPIINELNSIVRQNWASHEKISRVYKTANTYKCHPDTYEKLKAYLINNG